MIDYNEVKSTAKEQINILLENQKQNASLKLSIAKLNTYKLWWE